MKGKATMDATRTAAVMQSDFDKALAACHAALDADPCNKDVMEALAKALDMLGRLPELEPVYLRALSVAPDEPTILGRYTILLRKLGRLTEAFEVIEKARAVAPLAMDFYILAASIAVNLDELEAAERICRQGLALAPDAKVAVTLTSALGTALHRMNRQDAAVRAFTRARELDDSDPDRHLLGLSLAQLAAGDVDGARDSARQRLASLPEDSSVDVVRAQCLMQVMLTGKCQPDWPEVEQLQVLARRDDLNPEARIHVEFALGSALQALGRHDEAFRHFQAGNARRRDTRVFDWPSIQAEHEQIKATLTADRIKRLQRYGNSSDRPVFIVGMPRSGTSLVEQIITAHPRASGGGELNFIRDLAFGRAAASPHLCGQNPYPAWLALPEAKDLIRLVAGEYLYRAGKRAGTGARFTDKMPLNFRFAGLIGILFPKAHIIHVRRDPVDTCLACYTTHFASGNVFANDLTDLGAYYRLYIDLMAHWHKVMPGRIVDVSYEDLVRNPEGESRRMIEALGLPWDDSVLDFQANSQGMRTASAAQVRRPIYTSSVGRAAAYRAHLDPLYAALGDLAQH